MMLGQWKYSCWYLTDPSCNKYLCFNDKDINSVWKRRHRLDPWVRKIPRRRNGNPLQYSCLETPMDRGAWQAIVLGVAKLDTTEREKFFLLFSRPALSLYLRSKESLLSSWCISSKNLVRLKKCLCQGI